MPAELEPTYATQSLEHIMQETPGRWPFRSAQIARVLGAFMNATEPNAPYYYVLQLETGRFALVRCRVDWANIDLGRYCIIPSVTCYPTTERMLACVDDFVRANGDVTADAEELAGIIEGRIRTDAMDLLPPIRHEPVVDDEAPVEIPF